MYACLPSGQVYACLPSGQVYACLPSGQVYACLPYLALDQRSDVCSLALPSTGPPCRHRYQAWGRGTPTRHGGQGTEGPVSILPSSAHRPELPVQGGHTTATARVPPPIALHGGQCGH